jgi:hypothetical protein
MDPNMIMEKSITAASIKPGSKPNQLVLKLDSKLGAFEAYEFRNKMANDTAEIRKSITKTMKEENGSFKLTDIKVDNLYIPDAALKLHIEAVCDLDEDLKTIYFNPFINKLLTKNPFSAPTRSYPIEMDYREDKTYVMNIQLPAGYVIDDYPKSTSFSLNEKGDIMLKNQYTYDAATNTLSIKSSFQSSECTYPSAAYDGIKMLYNKCIETQNEKIVIKKSDLK